MSHKPRLHAVPTAAALTAGPGAGPGAGPTRDELRTVVGAAGAAPSLHNTQPWLWEYTSGGQTATLVLRAQPSRQVVLADPRGQAMHVSCGAALLNLRAAAAHLGFTAAVQRLPDTGAADVLARVRLARAVSRPSATGGVDTDLAALGPQVARRHSSRCPFTDVPVPEQVRAEMAHAAAAEGATLVFPSAARAARLLGLLREAEEQVVIDPQRSAELERWTVDAPPGLGVPPEAFGPRPRRGVDVGLPLRDFARGRPTAGRDTATFGASPQLATLATHDDGPAVWLRAGEALERVWLVATAVGVRISLLQQALEWAPLMPLLRDPAHGVEFVQAVIRFGHGPQGAATPRLEVAEILREVPG